GDRAELLRDAAAGGEEGDVDPVEARFGQLLDDELAAAERHLLACRSGRRQQLELCEREVALLETTDQLDADGAGGADDGNDGIRRVHVSSTPLDARPGACRTAFIGR